MKNNIKHIIILLLGVLFTLATLQNSTLATTKMTPYLQAVTTNSVYVLVESDSTSQVKVECGTTTAYGLTAYTETYETTTASPVTYIHNIKLTGLQPNTYYHYRVSQGGGTPSADYTFGTTVNPGTSFRFAWMADCRTGTSIHNSIASLIQSANPRFSLYGGDLCYDSSYNKFKTEFFLPNESALIANVPFFNAAGNHETWGTNTKAFTQDTSTSGNQGYYSFDYGDVHVLVLNYMDPNWNNIVGSAQYNFAQADLQSTTKRWKIVTCHCPAYCAGGDGSNATMQTLTTNIFKPNHVDLVLAGHSHFYQHNLVNGIHHVIIGGGGAPLHTPGNASYTLKSVQDYCYGIIDETPTSLNLSVYNAQNTLLDTVVILGTKGDWNLEGNGKDQSPYHNDGTVLSGVSFATGVVGQTAKFNGSSGYIGIPNYSSFNNMKAFTLAAWIYPTAFNAYNSIISKVDPNRDFNLQLYANGKINVHFAYGSTYYNCTGDNPVPLNKWSHVAAVWTGTKWQLYYNGILVKEADYTGFVPPWTGTQMEIGCLNHYSDSMFNGKIDEVKVFKGKLTADQIKAEYANGIAAHAP
jgi:hypothetical protein